MAIQLGFIDPDGDGTAYPTPYPAGLNKTAYNGDGQCTACGLHLGPVQKLNSDLCPGCSRRKAANSIANRMA